MPLLTLHIIFATIDFFFHSYGPRTQPLPLSYNYYARTAAGSNETSSSSSSSSSSTFAIVINTYKRPDMLQAAVQHYADTCGRDARIGVAQVFVVWAELNVTPPDPASLFLASSWSSSLSSLRRLGLQKTSAKMMNPSAAGAAAPVEIIRVAVDSLNSRFLPIVNLSSASTRAIFMVDDDVLVDCFSLHQGFLAWQSSPDSMVGYYPRLAAAAISDDSSRRIAYVYHSWPMVFWRQEMNFVLTKAAFLHSRYLDLYSSSNDIDGNDDDVTTTIHTSLSQTQREIRAYVDEHRNCEDVAMAMLIAHVTAMESKRANSNNNINDTSNEKTTLPAMPIYVQGHVSDKGLFHGISTGKGHFPQRSKCLNDLTRIYRQRYTTTAVTPLVEYRVPLRQAAWVHPAPGFWWQYRPSNIFEWFAIQDIFQ
jgi:Glycosyl transferase family 64 domain